MGWHPLDDPKGKAAPLDGWMDGWMDGQSRFRDKQEKVQLAASRRMSMSMHGAKVEEQGLVLRLPLRQQRQHQPRREIPQQMKEMSPSSMLWELQVFWPKSGDARELHPIWHHESSCIVPSLLFATQHHPNAGQPGT